MEGSPIFEASQKAINDAATKGESTINTFGNKAFGTLSTQQEAEKNVKKNIENSREAMEQRTKDAHTDTAGLAPELSGDEKSLFTEYMRKQWRDKDGSETASGLHDTAARIAAADTDAHNNRTYYSAGDSGIRAGSGNSWSLGTGQKGEVKKWESISNSAQRQQLQNEELEKQRRGQLQDTQNRVDNDSLDVAKERSLAQLKQQYANIMNDLDLRKDERNAVMHVADAISQMYNQIGSQHFQALAGIVQAQVAALGNLALSSAKGEE